MEKNLRGPLSLISLLFKPLDEYLKKMGIDVEKVALSSLPVFGVTPDKQEVFFGQTRLSEGC